MILKYIINYCEVYNNNKKIEKAIITVPAHFNKIQREDILKAGKLAGLKEIKLLNEATAAAIVYGNKFKSYKEMKILVFDIGRGNFNISILSVKGNKYKVLSSCGITNLREDNFNQ
jgi:molecular chaperone DnaK (HSP70)